MYMETRTTSCSSSLFSPSLPHSLSFSFSIASAASNAKSLDGYSFDAFEKEGVCMCAHVCSLFRKKERKTESDSFVCDTTYLCVT